MNLLGVVGHHIGHEAAMATMPDGLHGAGVAAYGGPVELYLGKAAAHLGDLESAVRDLQTALEAVVTGGSPAFEAEVCVDLADALSHRGQGGDTVRALELAQRGAHLTRRLDMTPWRAKPDALLERLAVPDQLTRREREVANLVAEGMTNRQIAENLYISERTAQTHVQHILTKLGFSACAQIASWITAAPSLGRRADQ